MLTVNRRSKNLGQLGTKVEGCLYPEDFLYVRIKKVKVTKQIIPSARSETACLLFYLGVRAAGCWLQKANEIWEEKNRTPQQQLVVEGNREL